MRRNSLFTFAFRLSAFFTDVNVIYAGIVVKYCAVKKKLFFARFTFFSAEEEEKTHKKHLKPINNLSDT